MITITIDGDLDRRLREAARRLGRPPEECALSAIKTFVADCEEAARNAARLGGGVHRPDEDTWD